MKKIMLFILFILLNISIFSLYSINKKNIQKNKTEVNFKGFIIKGADPDAFQIFENSVFLKDKNNVYHIISKTGPLKIEGADSETFSVLTWKFAKDRNNVYWGYEKIQFADTETFVAYEKMKSMSDNINYNAEDKNNYYLNGKIVKKNSHKRT